MRDDKAEYEDVVVHGILRKEVYGESLHLFDVGPMLSQQLVHICTQTVVFHSRKSVLISYFVCLDVRILQVSESPCAGSLACESLPWSLFCSLVSFVVIKYLEYSMTGCKVGAGELSNRCTVGVGELSHRWARLVTFGPWHRGTASGNSDSESESDMD
jgi:hypothetical protein